MRAISFIFLFVGITSFTFAQSRYRMGILPQLNFTKTLSKSWKLASKIEARQIISSGTFGQSNESTYTYERTDIAILASKKTDIGHSLSSGYMIRIRNQQLIHRLIQQYAIVSRFSNFRLGHRFSADQTFSSLDAPTFRFRYRITFDLPLNGQKPDAKESYFKINHEYLSILQAKELDLEIRLIPAYGYLISDQNKIEAGIDYRLDGIFNRRPRQNYWLYLAWYRSL